MFCGSANGTLLPPMIVYKALNLYENWTQGGPLGTAFACSKSGWFEMTTFKAWFLRVFVPNTRHLTGEILLIGDNLASHFSPKVIQVAQELNIYFTALPPNSTHLMQPLDVCFFAPLKKAWRTILMKWRHVSRVTGSISKEVFHA